ncbi:enoyl-CoA hydratase/isomerase family protein [Halorarius halobius]|uniref:enoyl-CoA hydratase/isomerase family protein n=1 Tax=Halorarius halobius TaxID=2962671 RepID=UPI0020CEB8DD|nr:enoyl-CoA hydratase-related protein [Halorarius halobius]
MSEDATIVDINNGVATITLNQPDLRNALTEDIALGLLEALEEVEGSTARCVVIEGADGAFSAGGDINAMVEGLEGEIPLEERVQHIVETTGKAIARVYKFSLPTIAKIEGPAFGAGANLAIACDIQLASESSQISFGFRQVGLAVDAGTSYLLPRIVGENTAQELVLTGELLTASRAEQLGLFNHVYPEEQFDEQVEEFVDEIATGPTVALRASTRLIRQGLDQSVEDALHDEAAAQAAVFETQDHEEGVSAFKDRRNPNFEGK